MVRPDHSLTVALCVSLVAHTGMVFVLAGRALDNPQPDLLSLRRAENPVDSQSPIYLARRPPPPTDLLFGAQDGAGDAANSAPGDRPLVGRDAGQVQAFLSRDPIGGGHVGEEPTMNVVPPSEWSNPPAAQARPLIVAMVDSAPAFGVRGPDLPAPHMKRDLPLVSEPAEQAPRLNDGAPASSNAPAADPAMMSDSESDPFARSANSIEFHDGRVDVRYGRKVKTVRPRLSLAAKYDLLGMQYPRMVVRMYVESSGEVRRVDIVKSTGSDSADQEVKVALYQWWIEPPKDKRGVALADVVEFPIVWR
jgi:TonB family protein